MIAESTAEIIKNICDLHANAGGICAEWCIGVTGDVERHLFGELRIARDYPWYIHRRAISAKEARAIAMGFRNTGFELSQVGAAVDDDSAVCVFAYRKTIVAESPTVNNTLRV